MYTGFHLCPELQPKTRCIVLRRYQQGEIVDLYHCHVAEHRLNNDKVTELLKALVIRFSEFEADHIVRCYLSSRGSDPASADPFRFHTEYPEPGVIRHSCGTNVQAWCDVVIVPEKFRPATPADNAT
jgi:hypothetical protein